MALKRNDCILLLTELQERGIDVSPYLTKLMYSKDMPIDVLKFINSNRQLEVAKFYEKIRSNYNKKKSDLYINIVKEIEEPSKVLTTLSAMLTQILLYSNKLPIDEKQAFLSHSRAEEITLVLDDYFSTYDISKAIKLLKLIKADIKTFEELKD